jgi:DNA-binding CsgD family transcriptional regulator
MRAFRSGYNGSLRSAVSQRLRQLPCGIGSWGRASREAGFGSRPPDAAEDDTPAFDGLVVTSPGEQLSTIPRRPWVPDNARDRFNRLTPREREVFAHLISGQLNKQIGFDLGITERTIKVHRHQVLTKMQANSVADLVRMAEDLGIGPVGVVD